jgi:hypothetical protein
MRITALAATGLVLALVACNKSGDQSAANGSAAGAGSAPSATAPAAARGATIRPGLWEVSYEANVSGANLPPAYAAAMKGHKDTKRDCITPEEAAEPVHMMKDKDSACDYSGFSFRDGRIQGTIVCGGKAAKTSMTMNGQYDAQNYAYTSTMTNQTQGMTMTIETKAIGHRVGECPAGGTD